MNKKILAALIAAAVLASALGAWLYLRGERPADGTISLHGNVDIRQVELAFDASGRIAAIEVREGDTVEAGQVLARLDTVRQRFALAQAQAQAVAQREVVKRLLAGSRPEEIRQARAQRDAARVALDDAEAYYRREQSLVERKFVSQQQADSARFAVDKARAQWQAAAASARLAELGPRQEEIATARATLVAYEAAAAQLLHDVDQGVLLAPSAGIIDKRILEVGDMASSQKTVFTLTLNDPLWVRVWLPEDQLGRIPTGALATVHTDSHPDKSYTAWVGTVSPSAEFTPKSVETAEVRSSLVYQARIYVCDGARELRQGMPATVRIALDQKVDDGAPHCPTADATRPAASEVSTAAR